MSEVISMTSDIDLSSSSDKDMVLDLFDADATTVHSPTFEHSSFLDSELSYDENMLKSPSGNPDYESSDDGILQSPSCSHHSRSDHT